MKLLKQTSILDLASQISFNEDDELASLLPEMPAIAAALIFHSEFNNYYRTEELCQVMLAICILYPQLDIEALIPPQVVDTGMDKLRSTDIEADTETDLAILPYFNVIYRGRYGQPDLTANYLSAFDQNQRDGKLFNILRYHFFFLIADPAKAMDYIRNNSHYLMTTCKSLSWRLNTGLNGPVLEAIRMLQMRIVLQDQFMDLPDITKHINDLTTICTQLFQEGEWVKYLAVKAALKVINAKHVEIGPSGITIVSPAISASQTSVNLSDQLIF